MMIRRLVTATVLTLVSITAAAGCASSPERSNGTSGCVPLFEVTPKTARAGDTVTFSASDRCDVAVPHGGWRIAVDGGEVPPDAASSDVARSDESFDGSWTVSVPLPSDLAPGDAMVSISNWDYSHCPDGARCAGPFANFTVSAPTASPTAAPVP